MTIEMYMLLFLLALVFNVCAFIWSDRLFIIIMSFVLWEVVAVSGGTVSYVGFGSQNVIPQTYSAGDPLWPAFIMQVPAGVGIMMLMFGVGQLWGDFRESGNNLLRHQKYDPLGGK